MKTLLTKTKEGRVRIIKMTDTSVTIHNGFINQENGVTKYIIGEQQGNPLHIIRNAECKGQFWSKPQIPTEELQPDTENKTTKETPIPIPWTPEKENELQHMWNSLETTIPEIAKHFNTNTKRIYNKIHALRTRANGTHFRKRYGNRYTKL